MKKIGDKRDAQRRYNSVKKFQDRKDWRENLPLPNYIWPTCLIVAPATVVHNWEREFQTVCVQSHTCAVHVLTALVQWGYFEVGIYTGSDREQVLHDFKLGRLDVRECVPCTKDMHLSEIIRSLDVIRNCPF